MSEPRYPCPCCGFLVFETGPGSYDLCPICNWEDDEVQLRYPAMAGGANGYSLWQEQQRILRHYPVAITEAIGYLRDPQWRPLTPSECVDETAPKTGREYFDALGAEPATYYWCRP